MPPGMQHKKKKKKNDDDLQHVIPRYLFILFHHMTALRTSLGACIRS